MLKNVTATSAWLCSQDNPVVGFPSADYLYDPIEEPECKAFLLVIELSAGNG